jgi:hypothetical protein
MARVRRLVVLCCALVACLAAVAAYATTLMDEERGCPVCGERVTALIPMSTNNFGGQDRDWLQRARGTQVISVVVTTCGRCGFTGYPDEFVAGESVDGAGGAEAAVDDRGDLSRRERRRARKRAKAEQVAQVGAGLPADLVRAIRDEGALELPEGIDEQAGYDGLPAWAKYDLMGQVAALRNAGDVERGDAALWASWTVRLGSHLDPLPSDDPDAEAWTSERRRALWEEGEALGQVNEPDVGTWVGARLLADLDQAPAASRCHTAHEGIAWLRRYGEHEAVLQALPLLEPCWSAEAWPDRERKIRASVALERRYQQRALDHYRVALDAGTVSDDELMWTVYTVGELARRLGDGARAVEAFERALAMEAMVGGFAAATRDQRCLAAGGGGHQALLGCRQTFVEEIDALRAEEEQGS